MPDRWEVVRAADRLHADGVRVSVRNVIPKLRNGGSHRAVGALLQEWKAERNYRPGLEPKGLPEKVQALLGSAVADLWKAAHADAAAELVAERERLEVDRRAVLEIMDEALARLDVAEAEMARLRERLASQGDGAMPARCPRRSSDPATWDLRAPVPEMLADVGHWFRARKACTPGNPIHATGLSQVPDNAYSEIDYSW